jgi:hypothetical protein
MSRLSDLFFKETGVPAVNSQGEPDVEYVSWLEARVDLIQGLIDKQPLRSDVPCGDCGVYLPLDLECDNPKCVRVIMRHR